MTPKALIVFTLAAAIMAGFALPTRPRRDPPVAQVEMLELDR